jgi:hypothetical protein
VLFQQFLAQRRRAEPVAALEDALDDEFADELRQRGEDVEDQAADRRPVWVFITGGWFQIAGILNPIPLAPEINRSALAGFPVAARLLGYDEHTSRLCVRTAVGQTATVAGILAPTADAENPTAAKSGRPATRHDSTAPAQPGNAAPKLAGSPAWRCGWRCGSSLSPGPRW